MHELSLPPSDRAEAPVVTPVVTPEPTMSDHGSGGGDVKWVAVITGRAAVVGNRCRVEMGAEVTPLYALKDLYYLVRKIVDRIEVENAEMAQPDSIQITIWRSNP